MPATEAAFTGSGIAARIAALTGLPPVVIEIALALLIILAVIAAVALVLAVFRIRKELISLNVKIIYIGRMLERAFPAPPISSDTAPKPPGKAAARATEEAEAAEDEEKWKL